MNFEDINDNLDKIITKTNRYLENYGYRYMGEVLYLETYRDGSFQYVEVFPKDTMWNKYIFTWTMYGDIYFSNEYTPNDKVKLTFSGIIVEDAPDLIASQLFLDLIEERNFLQSELDSKEEQEEMLYSMIEEMDYECERSEY